MPSLTDTAILRHELRGGTVKDCMFRPFYVERAISFLTIVNPNWTDAIYTRPTEWINNSDEENVLSQELHSATGAFLELTTYEYDNLEDTAASAASKNPSAPDNAEQENHLLMVQEEHQTEEEAVREGLVNFLNTNQHDNQVSSSDSGSSSTAANVSSSNTLNIL